MLSRLTYYVFTPCLIFHKLASAVTPAHLLHWWPIPVNVLLSVLLGLGLGWLRVRLVETPPWFRRSIIAATGLGNVGNLPLVLVAALVHEARNGPLSMLANTSSDLAMAYVAMGIWVATLMHFTIGAKLLRLEEPPATDMEKGVEPSAPAVLPLFEHAKRPYATKLGSAAGEEQERLLPIGFSSSGAQVDVVLITGSHEQLPSMEQHMLGSIEADSVISDSASLSSTLRPTHEAATDPLQPVRAAPLVPGDDEAAASALLALPAPWHDHVEGLQIAAPCSSSVDGAYVAGGRVPCADHVSRLAARAAAAYRVVHPMLTPPIWACILSFGVGAVPPLQRALFNTTGSLYMLADCIGMFGDCAIPCMLITLGATLEKGPGSGKLPAGVIIGSILTRMVIVPILGTAMVMGTWAVGLYSPPDPIFMLVMLIQNTVPTALNVHTLSVLYGNRDTEMSCLLFWQYLSSVFIVPAFLMMYLYLAEAYLVPAA